MIYCSPRDQDQVAAVREPNHVGRYEVAKRTPGTRGTGTTILPRALKYHGHAKTFFYFFISLEFANLSSSPSATIIMARAFGGRGILAIIPPLIHVDFAGRNLGLGLDEPLKESNTTLNLGKGNKLLGSRNHGGGPGPASVDHGTFGKNTRPSSGPHATLLFSIGKWPPGRSRSKHPAPVTRLVGVLGNMASQCFCHCLGSLFPCFSVLGLFFCYLGVPRP